MCAHEKAEEQSSFESGGDPSGERVSPESVMRKRGCMSYKFDERLVRPLELAVYFKTEAAWSCGETGLFTHHHNWYKE